MPIDRLQNIVQDRPKDCCLLGIDVGKKTLGLALSDPDHVVATPLRTINRVKFTKDMEALVPIIQEFEIGGFVIGLPIGMSGEEGRRAQSIRDFAQEFEKYIKNCPHDLGIITGKSPWIALWDERLSTATVESFVDSAVGKRKTRANAKASGLIDKLAAQVILQGALEFMEACS